jgi:hypothetical protein
MALTPGQLSQIAPRLASQDSPGPRPHSCTKDDPQTGCFPSTDALWTAARTTHGSCSMAHLARTASGSPSTERLPDRLPPDGVRTVFRGSTTDRFYRRSGWRSYWRVTAGMSPFGGGSAPSNTCALITLRRPCPQGRLILALQPPTALRPPMALWPSTTLRPLTALRVPMTLRPPMTSTPDTSAAHGTSDTNDNSVCLRPRCPGRVRRRRRPPGCPQRVCEAHAIGLEVLATPWGTHCTRVERWPTAGERFGALVAYAHSWAAPPRSWQGFDTPRERAAHSWSTAPHPPIPPPRPHITPRRGSCRDPLNSRLRGHTHWVGLQRACLVGCVRVS